MVLDNNLGIVCTFERSNLNIPSTYSYNWVKTVKKLRKAGGIFDKIDFIF